MPPPTTLFPVSERFVDVARETTPGTAPASPGSTIPVSTFKPSDKPMWLRNEAWYGVMGDVYGILQGPLIGGFDIGGPYFGDMVGHVLLNIMGDYTTTGTTASPASTLSAPVSAGGTALTVASGGASFTQGMAVWIEDGGTPALNEVVIVANGATATNIPLSTPLRFAHSTSTPFTNTTAPYSHIFSLLNTNTSVGLGAGQPFTHTFTDRTGIPATDFAAQYTYACFNELTITGNAEQLLTWEAKAISNVRAIAAAPLSAPAASAVQPYPSWRSTTKLTPVGGGALTQVNDIGEWAITVTRQVKPYFTNQNSQAPYVIARGRQGATGKLTIAPAIDETSVLYLLANTQPQIQIAAANGLAGANAVSLQADIGLAAYEQADLADGDELFGYDVNYVAVHSGATFNSITMTGASGGQGCVKFTLQNAIPSY